MFRIKTQQVICIQCRMGRRNLVVVLKTLVGYDRMGIERLEYEVYRRSKSLMCLERLSNCINEILICVL